MVRLGVLGAGFIGKVHLEKFGKVEGVALAGLFDPFTDLAKKAAADFKVERVFSSAEELLASQEIDAVVVAVPNKLHAPTAIRALEAGKHVLLEKPMAMNGREAAAIEKAARKAGRKLMIAHQERWRWASRQAALKVESGDLGRVYNAKAWTWRRSGIPGWGSWFTRMDEAGGGPLIDIGVHSLDLALSLMGGVKPVSVFGSTYAEFGPRKKGLGTWGTPQWDGRFDVEDLATALIKLENGATLTLEVSWAAHAEPSSGVILMGTEGGAKISGDEGTLFTTALGLPVDIPLPAKPATWDPRVELSRHFVDCVVNDRLPYSHGATGVANSLVLEAIYTSARKGKSVDLDWSVLE